MEIASISSGALTPKTSPSVAPGSTLSELSTDHLRAHLDELDTNSDGYLSDDEFAAYRAEKQAKGQFIPLDAPVSEKVQQAMFAALVKRNE